MGCFLGFKIEGRLFTASLNFLLKKPFNLKLGGGSVGERSLSLSLFISISLCIALILRDNSAGVMRSGEFIALVISLGSLCINSQFAASSSLRITLADMFYYTYI